MVGANKQMCRNSHVLFTKSETGDKLAKMTCEYVKIDQTLCFQRGKSGDRCSALGVINFEANFDGIWNRRGDFSH